MKRLQDHEWHEKKETLTPIKFIQKDNKVKGIYQDSKGKEYCHWLNDEEISELSIELDKNYRNGGV